MSEVPHADPTSPETASSDPSFVYVTCQVGAENVLKAEFARRWPSLRFAYSRPGFLTFKSAEPLPLDQDVPCRGGVFARATGHSLGRVQGSTPAERAAALWELLGDSAAEYEGLHVWARDLRAPGEHGYEPGVTPEAIEAAAAIRRAAPAAAGVNTPGPVMQALAASRAAAQSGGEADSAEEDTVESETADGGETAGIVAQDSGASDGEDDTKNPSRGSAGRLRTWVQPGTKVLDCILIEPGTWWVGQHTAVDPPSCWPGGFPRIRTRGPIISRAFFKLEEALQWSGLPLRERDRVADLGCAPGGASQSLLQRGLWVFAVDPADPHPGLFESKNFWHEKKRGADVRRRDFRGIKWLTADMNVAPSYTLDTVENIVTHDEVDIRGLVLTLKLLEWDLAAEIPDYAFRVRTWGYQHVQVRQLATNRQEVCLVAWKD